MRQERDDHRRIEILDRKPRRPGSQPFSGEVEQQLEAEGIGLAGLRAVASLIGHVIAQEAGDERSELRHVALSPTSISAAVAISAINSGVVSRYQ